MTECDWPISLHRGDKPLFQLPFLSDSSESFPSIALLLTKGARLIADEHSSLSWRHVDRNMEQAEKPMSGGPHRTRLTLCNLPQLHLYFGILVLVKSVEGIGNTFVT